MPFRTALSAVQRLIPLAFSLLALSGCGFLVSTATYRCTVGSTWQTLDSFSAGSGVATTGLAIWGDSSGNIFTGSATGNGTPDNWVIRKRDVTTGTWSQLNSYTYSGTSTHEPRVGLVASNGYLFNVGNVYGGASDIWLVRRSTDSGQTWTNVDNYTASDIASATGNFPETMYEDPASGRLFVGGTVYRAVDNYGVVRMSSDRGATWTRVEAFQYVAGQSSAVVSNFAKDASGNLYWGGCGAINGTTWYGIIRKSSDQGSTWSTYASIPPTGTNTQVCIYGLYFGADGKIYATGQYNDSGGVTHASAYLSTNSGQSFTQIDDYQYASGKSTMPDIFSHTLAVDNSGGLYYAVKATDSSNKIHAVIRRSGNGTAWITSDDYVLASGQDSAPTSIIRDAFGNILTYGYYKNSAAVNQGLVRKLSCNP